MSEWSFEQLRALHQLLGAVKWCKTCCQYRPITDFRMPAVRMYRGYDDCRACCQSRERARRSTAA